MNKRITVVCAALAMFLVASFPARTLAKKKVEPPPKPDLTLLDIDKWDETVYKMVAPPTENGNAMAYFLEASHFSWEGGGEKSKIPYDWWKELNRETYESDEPEKVAIVAKAIKIPELELMVKGSRQKNYQWVGIYFTPSPDPNKIYYTHKLPNYMNFFKFGQILIARADDKLAKGDKAGAEADMFAALRIGHIMQKDVVLIGYMVGLNLELKIAKVMPDFYRDMGDEAKAKEWEELIPIFEKHKEASRDLMKYIQSIPIEQIPDIIRNTSLPRSFRTESMIMAVGNDIMSHIFKFTIHGPSKELKNLLLTEYFEDPEMRIIQLKVIEDIFVFFGSFKKRMDMK